MFIDLHNSEDIVISSVKNTKDNVVESNLRVFTNQGKLILRAFINAFLDKHNVDHEHKNYIIESLFELIYNALKANYLHVYTLSLLKSKFPELKNSIDSGHYFILDENVRRSYMDFRQSQPVKDKIKSLMKLEAALIKQWDTNGEIDISKYDELHSFKNIINKPVRIRIVLSKRDNICKCSIINQSPVTMLDFARIHDKRRIFREYYDKGTLNKFYEENLDESESAGFGATLIDLRLLDMGLEPYDHFTITTDGIHTKASISFTIN